MSKPDLMREYDGTDDCGPVGHVLIAIAAWLIIALIVVSGALWFGLYLAMGID